MGKVMDKNTTLWPQINDAFITEICVMKERIEELEEHMKECASVLSWVLENARPESDWETFTNSVTNAMVEAESLINKGKWQRTENEKTLKASGDEKIKRA